MCGIVGLFAKRSAVEERLGEHLGDMLEQMGDRGPDSAGVAFYREPAPAGATKVSLHSPQAEPDWDRVAAVCATPSAEIRVRRCAPATPCSWSRPAPRTSANGCRLITPGCA